ncbi:hypothetical protein JVT61DRAFT_6704 [Boletus reticuloceps]|uniref:Uncharacterized protein n=1 Tax=Boletus reticuloceps TaxID=495285 RepID=A0A8I2YKB4_9AGAM|nr:hypothetical protein JVT61DRAFT_6704 [Boletus reticuloceps]
MANLTRSAKSGNDWKQGDLRAYNIKVVFEDTATFFGGPLPQPTIRPEILTTKNPADDQDDDLYVFLALLQRASRRQWGEESAVIDFVVNLFRELRYTRKTRLSLSRKDLQFHNCGESRQVKTDICILDYPAESILLLVQEDKRHLDEADPESQLIAKAIAAYSNNRYIRSQEFWSPQAALEEQVLFGITMTGTSPTFYKIPVTSTLAEAIEEGEYPAQQTVVQAYLPELPRPHDRFKEKMEPLDNRHIMISCFEAFRQFV